MKSIRATLIPIILFFFCSCDMIGAGTHGKLKGYWYKTDKVNLENAILKLIENDSLIYRDTTDKGYYNNGSHYLTIKILNKEMSNEYILGYYGSKRDWEQMDSSSIAICYAYDKYNRGGDELEKDFPQELKNELVRFFEEYFITKLDRELGLQHTEEL